MVGIPGAKRRNLTVGDLTFTAWEMGEGPLALCLHGFPDTPTSWRYLLPTLAANGWRAVAVTSRGYEPSSQPADGDYGIAALSDDVGGWIEALGETSAVLIGHDWGAAIAYAAAAKFPDRIHRLVTLSVPHPLGWATQLPADFEQLKRTWYVFMFQVPGLAEILLEANDWAYIERLWRDWSPCWDFDPSDLESVKAALATPGVKAAALGYYRAAFDADAPRLSEGRGLALIPIAAPTLGLVGKTDGCISSDIFIQAMPRQMFPGGLDVQVIENAGHFLQLENPDAVNGAILDWLAGG